MQTIREPLNERSTRELEIPFLDADGAAISDGVVATLTATLRDLGSDTLIRTAESVLNANGGVLSGGTLTLVLDPDDTQVIGTASLQPRVLTLSLVTSGGVRITEEIHFLVRSMRDIT
ncbi:MAG TPA: hypothetical protein PKC83_11155 [Gemmatimonadaceae bacterium]|nr:hypothetical protein [Gemmatimonadaceae bacterium]